MKKTMALATALVVAALTSAQMTPTYQLGINSPIPLSYIPADFMSNHQPGIAAATLDMEDPLNSQMKIYDNQFHAISQAMALPVTTGVTGGYFEEYYDEVQHTWLPLYGNGSSDNAIITPAFMLYLEMGNTGVDALTTFAITQTMFNEDADFEYLVPVTTVIEGEKYYWDGDRYDEQRGEYVEVQCRDYQNNVMATAFNITKVGGAVAGTITLPEGFYCPLVGEDEVMIPMVGVMKIMGQNYLIIPAMRSLDAESPEDVKVLVYSFDGATQQVSLVSDELPISVFPSLVNRGNDITVELGEGSNASQISVIDQSGRVVNTVSVQPGQKRVKVNTSNMSKGVNFINAINGKKSGSYKVVVR